MIKKIYGFIGTVGGARTGMPLRSLLGELGCISVSNMFTIPRVHNAFSEDGQPLETEEVHRLIVILFVVVISASSSC